MFPPHTQSDDQRVAAIRWRRALSPDLPQLANTMNQSKLE
jgi:hypothetical protein